MALKFPQLHVVENNKKSLGIYVHIPFCRSKCEYCDFYSLPGARDKDRMDEYTAALVAHIREAATGANGYEVDTVYFGGGTPSFFGAGGLAASSRRSTGASTSAATRRSRLRPIRTL